MARVTTEDCTDKVSNRFDLVMLAAHRARELSSGKDSPQVTIDNDKNPVIALREIAGEAQTADDLKERAIRSCQTELSEDDEAEFTVMDASAMTRGRPNNEFREFESMSDASALRAIIKS